jgi:hypothetical protein
VSQIIEMSSVMGIQARIAALRADSSIRTQVHLRVANLSTGVGIWTLH